MTVTIPDPLAALITYLAADANVEALVADRVFGGSLPEEVDGKQMSVVVSPAGGGMLGAGGNDFGDIRVDVLTYGNDESEAWTVYLAVRRALKALQRQTIAGCLLHWAKPTSGGATGIDPVTSYALCIASFTVLAAEVSAA